MTEFGDPAIVAKIGARLEEVAREAGVAIPLAVESGSRAWGFPSPDSDYDCRFVFIRRQRDYLSPWPRRDVIELPIKGELDINGWDLAKALRLLAKGNATIVEWLTSPFAYRRDEGFAQAFLALAGEIADRRGMARHYFHLGEEQWRRHAPDPGDAPLKKALYALRPALALRWLRANPRENLPPMDLPRLIAESAPADDVAAAIEALVAAKANRREMGRGRIEPQLVTFIESEFDMARSDPQRPPNTPPPDIIEKAEAFFLRALERFG